MVNFKRKNKITKERQIVLMLALRMRKANQQWSTTAISDKTYLRIKSVFIEANNSYQIASQILYNTELHPRIVECKEESSRCQDCGSTNTRWIHNDDYCADCGSRSVW